MGQIDVGDLWGGPDVTSFFRKTINIPDSHVGTNVALDIFLDGGEAQLSINGRPWQGLDWYRSLVPLGEFAEAGRDIELSIEAFVINYPYDERRHDERDLHRFARARLVKVDREIEAFLYDARFVLEAYLSYWRDDSHHEIEGFLLHHLEEACRVIGPCLRISAMKLERRLLVLGRYCVRTFLRAMLTAARDGSTFVLILILTLFTCGRSKKLFAKTAALLPIC